MVTREQVEATFDDKVVFTTKNIDHDFKAISLLRERIPFEVCKSIIQGCGYEKIYLSDVDKSLPYLTEEDLIVLADCNCFIDEDNDSFALFV